MQGYLKLIIVGLFFALVGPVAAQDAVANFAQDPALKGASVSVVIADAETGAFLQVANPDQRLCPASVWKLFTTVAALKILDPDFRFQTVLAYRGEIDENTLHGDLFIIGGGDPSLGSRFFQPDFETLLTGWAEAVKAMGIDSISGRVVANASHYTGDGLPRTRIWEDMGNYYGAAVSGLNINDNSYSVVFDVPADIGAKAQIVSISPSVPGLEITSEVVSSTDHSDQAFIFGSPYSNRRIVRGTLPADRAHFEIKGSLPNPPLFAAWHLQKALEEHGIEVGAGITVERTTVHNPESLEIIETHKSPPLSKLVEHTIVLSDNLYAETMLYEIGVQKGGAGNAGGLKALKAFYQPISSGTYPFFAYDGSGLSRFGAVSTRQIISLLHYAAGDEMLRENLLNKLPLAGQEGTMRWFAKGTNLSGNLRGKSGSMEGVIAYAGVFNALTGRKLAFAVIINNYDGSSRGIKKLIVEMLGDVFMAY